MTVKCRSEAGVGVHTDMHMMVMIYTRAARVMYHGMRRKLHNNIT